MPVPVATADSVFMGDSIKQYISTYIHSGVYITATLAHLVRLNLTIYYQNNAIAIDLAHLLTVLNFYVTVLSSMSTKVAKLNITIYAADVPKRIEYPQQVFTADNINSGSYNHVTDTILIFRLEELYKVLLHELLHKFDVMQVPNHTLAAADASLTKHFNIHKLNVDTLRLDEGITETVATYGYLITRIMHTAAEQNWHSVYFAAIKREQLYLQRLTRNILDYAHYAPSQSSNLFAYYFVKCYLMNNKDFTTTCDPANLLLQMRPPLQRRYHHPLRKLSLKMMSSE